MRCTVCGKFRAEGKRVGSCEGECRAIAQSAKMAEVIGNFLLDNDCIEGKAYSGTIAELGRALGYRERSMQNAFRCIRLNSARSGWTLPHAPLGGHRPWITMIGSNGPLSIEEIDLVRSGSIRRMRECRSQMKSAASTIEHVLSQQGLSAEQRRAASQIHRQLARSIEDIDVMVLVE